MCSFKTTHAKMAAKNGAKYLKDTADPKGKYFNNENKKLSSNNRQGGL